MPFVNGGFHGEVATVVSTNGQGQVVSQAGVQPRVNPVRPSGTALNGAVLKTFQRLGPDQYRLSYSIPPTPRRPTVGPIRWIGRQDCSR